MVPPSNVALNKLICDGTCFCATSIITIQISDTFAIVIRLKVVFDSHYDPLRKSDTIEATEPTFGKLKILAIVEAE